ncbi:hypothetical protein [Parvularcula maris]|uniref:Flavodoxin-like domain-containing protein n=1 Tax=Parvularcula maris TaxID=2965077 RepID=A0A9X2LBF2_9PROT|nr:hypothetical protein [Parvularcula maris]MCQ8186625.1 hypothetical protein [Parvularcula maris]
MADDSNDPTAKRILELLEQEVVASGDDEETRALVDRTRRRFLSGSVAGAAAAGLAGTAVAGGVQEAPTKPRIMVVYTTDTNSTRRVAERVIAGVDTVATAEPRLLQTGREVSRDDMLSCDGLIIGTPVRHRNMHHRIKIFVEEVIEQLWLDDAMVGMVGGTFSVGGGYGDAGAGAEQCQLGLLAAMAANGMIMVPLPKATPGADHACCHWGPAVRTGGPKMEAIWPTVSALDCAYHHGANVARVTAQIKASPAPLFASGNVSPSKELLKLFQAGGTTMETADEVPARDSNPAFRQTTHPDYPSGDGFKSGK